MQTQTVQKTQTELKRGYSTQYEDHQGLIHKFARKGWGRLTSLGVSIDYEDVFQEMSVTYCRAASKFDPSRGFTFSAYLGQAIWHDFNKLAQRFENELSGLGFTRIEDMGVEDSDFYDRLTGNVDSPEKHSMHRQETAHCFRKLKRKELQVVGTLMRQTVSGDKDESLSEIMRSMHMSRTAMATARKNIGAAFGVSMKGRK